MMRRNLKAESNEMFNNRYGRLDYVVYGDLDSCCSIDNVSIEATDEDEPDAGTEDYVSYHLKKVVMSRNDLRSHLKETIINDYQYYTKDEVFTSVKHIVQAYPALQAELDAMGLDLLANDKLHHLLDLLSESCPNYKKLVNLPIHISNLYPDFGSALLDLSFCNYSAETLYETAKLIIEVFPEAQLELNSVAEYLIDKENMSLVLDLVTEHSISANVCHESLLSLVENSNSSNIGERLIYMVNNLKKFGVFDSLKVELREIAALIALIERVENDSVERFTEISQLFGLDKETFISCLSSYENDLEYTDFDIEEIIATANSL